MHKLTTKQEIFAQAIATGMSQLDAYLLVFSSSSDDLEPELVANKAAAFARKSRVLARIEMLKEEIATQSSRSKQESSARLWAIATDDNERTCDIIAAIRVLNVMHGFVSYPKVQ